MNVTKKQFEALKAIGCFIPCGKELKTLDREQREVIYQYDLTMLQLEDKRKRDNKRIAGYVAKKRKDNPNYARSKEVKK